MSGLVVLVAGAMLAGRGVRAALRSLRPARRPVPPIVLTVYVVEAGRDDDDGPDDDGDDDLEPDPGPPTFGAEVEVPVELAAAVEEIFS